jgi:hypothetical protein
MPVSSLDALPEAFVSQTALSSAISRGVRQGKSKNSATATPVQGIAGGNRILPLIFFA